MLATKSPTDNPYRHRAMSRARTSQRPDKRVSVTLCEIPRWAAFTGASTWLIAALLVLLCEGLKGIEPFIHPRDEVGDFLENNQLLGQGHNHPNDSIHKKHFKSIRRNTYPRGRASIRPLTEQYLQISYPGCYT